VDLKSLKSFEDA
jgi:ABC-type multidrug transport system fused ATPase/permease subunit